MYMRRVRSAGMFKGVAGCREISSQDLSTSTTLDWVAKVTLASTCCCVSSTGACTRRTQASVAGQQFKARLHSQKAGHQWQDIVGKT